MLIINIIPFKTFRERIRLVKDLKGTITIESNYIVAIHTIKGDK